VTHGQFDDDLVIEAPLLTADEADSLLSLVTSGNLEARERLLNVLYGELKGIARRLMSRDAAVLTLQPTELLHEAAMRLLRLDRLRWNDHGHFLAICTRLMRQVIIDEIRRVRAKKRQHIAVTTSFADLAEQPVDLDIEALDAALTQLAEVNGDLARIVELRFFVGLTTEETARLLDVSDSTIKRQWRVARAWLLAQIEVV
jgi:RNA polymerase sigma factor (TIGR02999 family)